MAHFHNTIEVPLSFYSHDVTEPDCHAVYGLIQPSDLDGMRSHC